MEELEDQTEHLKEIQESAEEKRKEKWILSVALSTAVMAVLAAIAGLLGNHHANEALLEKVDASDQWSYYQAKSIKSEIAASNGQLLVALGKELPPDNKQKTEKYEQEKAQINQLADAKDKSSDEHLARHLVFAKAVTFFQIAIAISAISILTRKRFLWYVSILLTVIGCFFLTSGLL